MKNILCLICVLIYSIGFLNAQSLVYTISGELNDEKVSLDSIIIENVSNSSRIVFDNLPAQDFYEIDLTAWNTTGITGFNESPGYFVAQNIPGLLVLTNNKNKTDEIRLSVYNITGKELYSSDKTLLKSNNSIKIEIGLSGIFMVKLDSPFGSQSFKTIGSLQSKEFNIDIVEKSISENPFKNAVISETDEFSYQTGDSIQISVFKQNYLSIPEGLKIAESEAIDFNLYNVEFIDPRDNKVYQTVRIGSQIWLAENLAYLPHVSPSSNESSTEPLIYVYGYEGTEVSEAVQTENFKTYGALYNWVSAQTVSPEGWHVASEEEWRQLELALGMSQEDVEKIGWRGTDEGSKLKSTTGWVEPGNGTNESGFSALPSGTCCPFGWLGLGCFWWSSTEKDELTARGRGLDKDHDNIVTLGSYKKFGFSLRCLRD